MVRKGVRFRLESSWGISRIVHLISFVVCAVMMVLGGHHGLQSQRLRCCVLVSYRVNDIDMLGGRSYYLCERLCCMVVVASDL